MLVQDKYVKTKTFNRKGLLRSLKVPTGLSVRSKKYNLCLDTSQKCISLELGHNVYILSDNLGVCASSEYSLFFVDDLLVIDLHKGSLYVKQSTDEILLIDSKNNIIPFIGNPQHIYWKSKSDMLSYCNSLVKSTFNLSLDSAVSDYVSNLIFTFNSSFNYIDGSLFSLRLDSLYYDLGLDIFNYAKKSDICLPLLKVLDLEPLQDEEYLDKTPIIKKNSKRMSDSFDIDFDDDIDDDIDEGLLPYNMHEVDIFNDYSSETPDSFLKSTIM